MLFKDTFFSGERRYKMNSYVKNVQPPPIFPYLRHFTAHFYLQRIFSKPQMPSVRQTGSSIKAHTKELNIEQFLLLKTLIIAHISRKNTVEPQMYIQIAIRNFPIWLTHRQLKIQHAQEWNDYLLRKVSVTINGTTIHPTILNRNWGILSRNPQKWGILSNKYNLSLEFPTMCSVKY